MPTKNLCNAGKTASKVSTGTINGLESWTWTCSTDTATESCSTRRIYIQKPISVTQLSSSDTGNGFGYATALSGDTAIVGAYDVGNAYIFTRSWSTWSEAKKLDGEKIVEKKSLFGHSVAISGDIVATGGAPAPSGGTTGAVYVFERWANEWNLASVLTPEKSDTVNNTKFGYSSIAIDGGTIIVGTGDRDTEYRSWVKEAAYVFTKSNGVWIQKQKLMASDGKKDDHFGTSVAISGDTVLVWAFGASHKNTDTTDRESKGVAYVFTRTNDTWTQTDKIAPSDLQYGDQFGISLAIDHDTAVIGTKHRDPNAHPASVYVYNLQGGKSTQKEVLTTGENRSCDLFGSSVSISGNTIIAPSYRTCNDGVVIRMFSRNTQGQWSSTLKSSVTEDDVGVFSSAVSGDLAIMGMPLIGSAQKNAYIVELPKQ